MSLDMLLIHGNGETCNEDALQRLEQHLEKYRPNFAIYDEFTFNAHDVIQAKERFSQFAQKYGCNIVLATNDKEEALVDTEKQRANFEEQKKSARDGFFYFSPNPEAEYLPGLPSCLMQLPSSLSFDEFLKTHYHRKDDGNHYEFKGNRKWATTREELCLAGITHEDVSDEHIRNIWEDRAYEERVVKEPDSKGNIQYRFVRGEFRGSDYTKDDFEANSVGFYFGSDGSIFAFPKQWEDVPVHRIPNTNIGVSICGEVNYVKPEHLEDIDILLNPSRENDDPFMRARTSIYAGQSFLEATEYLGKIDERTQEMVKKVSTYIGHNHDFCRDNNIIVTRADGKSASSGLMCLPKGLKVLRYAPNDDHSYIKLDAER
ncbi:MAG: hypothetical protein JW771_04220 [Candidatus Thermoplasmatota archaeon]|nr:hypothetical protein [Candidatus Thermoplasmatota archaeon]